MEKVQVVLELDKDRVEGIEELVGESIKTILEREINESDEDVFIEMMGYDNI